MSNPPLAALTAEKLLDALYRAQRGMDPFSGEPLERVVENLIDDLLEALRDVPAALASIPTPEETTDE